MSVGEIPEDGFVTPYGIEGSLDDGQLTFSVLAPPPGATLDPAIAEIYPEVRGKDLFTAMMLAYGNQVTSIDANWNEGGIFSDNYNTYQTHIENGATPQEAAAATWTGKMAKKWGYTEVSKPNETANPSANNQVKFSFKKPS